MQNKLSLWNYTNSPFGIPIGSVEGTLNGQIFSSSDHLAERFSMLKAAQSLLKRDPNFIFAFDALPENQKAISVIVLFGDLPNVALRPELMTDTKIKAPGRVLAFFAAFPDFTLTYLAALRKAVANVSDIEKAMAFMRVARTVKSFKHNIPLSEAHDKEIAREIGVTVDTVKKARSRLAAFDSERWERIKRK
jgi:hypothetical protein